MVVFFSRFLLVPWGFCGPQAGKPAGVGSAVSAASGVLMEGMLYGPILQLDLLAAGAVWDIMPGSRLWQMHLSSRFAQKLAVVEAPSVCNKRMVAV
ncbi:hypothetical protein U1Q18_041546 [Sarracenia purpurea var. burkii]